MKTGLNDLQAAIFTLLNDDTALSALIKGVFDGAAQGQDFPYITIGQAISDPFRTLSRAGEEIVETVTIWSQPNGPDRGPGSNREVLLIADEVNRLLADQVLTVAGFCVISYFDGMETLRDEDDVRQVVARYRITIQEE